MKLALVLGTVVVGGTLMAAYGPGERALVSLKPEAPTLRYLGYVEGETTLVAPPVAGRLVARPVERGDQIDKGQQLFVIDTSQAESEVARAAARLAEMQARHNNLLTGKRVEEQDVIRAQRRQVEATLVAAEAELGRQSELVTKNIVSRHNYDQAFANVAELRARAAALTARERAGDLAARQPEIDAAVAMIEQQQAVLARTKNQLAELMPVSPDHALVENTFFNVGEWVPAGSPVVSLLPDFRIKLRFFIPEPEVAKLRAGTRIRFNCDGCPPELKATVTYVAPRAEYTPPIIYSHGARAKLVFMVEARPDPMNQLTLQPGLPINVEAVAADAKTWAWR
jgi:HlyD family secretion protein